MLSLIGQLHEKHMLLGYIREDPGGPERNATWLPWYLTREEWPRDKYARFAWGGSGYVISMVCGYGLAHCIDHYAQE